MRDTLVSYKIVYPSDILYLPLSYKIVYPINKTRTTKISMLHVRGPEQWKKFTDFFEFFRATDVLQLMSKLLLLGNNT